jgi:hypothetical protein
MRLALGFVAAALGARPVPLRGLRRASSSPSAAALRTGAAPSAAAAASSSVPPLVDDADDSLRRQIRAREGAVYLRNTQRSEALDLARVERELRAIVGALGVAHLDVSVWLSSDATVRRHNGEFRGKQKSTDILSFPFHALDPPGDLAPAEAELASQVASGRAAARTSGKRCLNHSEKVTRR